MELKSAVERENSIRNQVQQLEESIKSCEDRIKYLETKIMDL